MYVEASNEAPNYNFIKIASSLIEGALSSFNN